MKKKKAKKKIPDLLNFKAGNYICPKISELFKEAGLNYNKFLCGGCTKRTHRDIKTGIWKDELECEATMVGAMLLSFKFTGMTNKKCDKFLKSLTEISLLNFWLNSFVLLVFLFVSSLNSS